jgi:hypothetical protein
MALILDHANGDARDNRIENLRILCPNCNATLDTHCGKNKSRGRPPRDCEHCGGSFRAANANQRFCSRLCAAAVNTPLLRRVARPPLERLLEELAAMGYKAVGRRYGVSDNAIRKWIRAEGLEAPPGTGRDHNPPPRGAALTDEEARGALVLLARGVPQQVVADSFGVSRWCIRDLRRGRSYRHVERPAALSARAA